MSVELSPWDRAIPYTNKETGYSTTLYNINVLANWLGRTSQTIRKWEIAGVIPKTPFKSDGKRLYSKEQIDILVECAEKANISTGKKMSQTNFTRNVQKKWQKLFDEIFKIKQED